MDIELAEKLLRLSVDTSTTEGERHNSSMALAKMLHETNFFPTVRKLISNAEQWLQWCRHNRSFLNRHGARLPVF